MEHTKFNHSKKIIVLLIAMSFLISVTAAVVSAKGKAQATSGSIYTTGGSAKISQSGQSSNSAITETTSTITTTVTSGDSKPTQTVSSTQTSGQPDSNHNHM
jgi:hypothetical protein